MEGKGHFYVSWTEKKKSFKGSGIWTFLVLVYLYF